MSCCRWWTKRRGAGARRHEHLEIWGINLVEGERLIEVPASLAAHAVAIGTSVSAAKAPPPA
ncbi:hypothetical protein [Streptomyces sp. NPDC056061]|uniref:hypothetical protein n=1 Tax=Streptomyces sp. NPDC056061 TaxID=3345700 RepID=UPI0035D75619